MTISASQSGARLVRAGLHGAIRCYQLGLRPLLAPSCRFTPSCSEYALQAIAVHGAGRGTMLATGRILRCSPLHAGGHDPVPPGRRPSSSSPP